MTKPINSLLRLGLSLLALMATGFGALQGLIDGAAYQDEKQPADAILVLGAGVLENGQPSPALEARVRHALHLYQQGYAPLIALTGGSRYGRPPEAAVARRWLLAHGVPDEAILAEERSQSTAQNLAYILPTLQAYDVDSVLLVTSPFHAWRSRLIAEQAGLTVYLSPAPDDPAEHKPLKRTWYIAREGVATILYWLWGI